MNISISLFEGIILLIITGVSGVAWWGVRRLVKMSDDAAVHLTNIDKSIAKICERLGQFDVWMDLHSKQDDERHEEIRRVYVELQDAIDALRDK
jgi:crotonobetainyl-CoA:carnitine CoA-transferase CaiB-like acyl-CoA transferase